MLGLFFFTTAFIPTFFRPFRIACVEIGLLTTSLRALVTWTAFSALPEPLRQIAWQMLVSESFVGWPPEDFWRLGQCLEKSLEMVALETPVWDEIWWPERPESRRERIWCCSAGVKNRNCRVETTLGVVSRITSARELRRGFGIGLGFSLCAAPS